MKLMEYFSSELLESLKQQLARKRLQTFNRKIILAITLFDDKTGKCYNVVATDVNTLEEFGTVDYSEIKDRFKLQDAEYKKHDSNAWVAPMDTMDCTGLLKQLIENYTVLLSYQSINQQVIDLDAKYKQADAEDMIPAFDCCIDCIFSYSESSLEKALIG